MAGSGRGFTLIEMITVMAIATLITIASAPAFMRFARTQRIRGTAGEIASALNSARRFAITRNMSYAIAVYTSHDDIEEDIRNSFLFWETEGALERKLFHRTVWIDEVTDGPEPETGVFEFTFTPRGALSGLSRTIWLEDTGGRRLGITVYNTTGRVRVGDLVESGENAEE